MAGTLRGGRGGAEAAEGGTPKERPRLAMKNGGEFSYSSTSSKQNSKREKVVHQWLLDTCFASLVSNNLGVGVGGVGWGGQHLMNEGEEDLYKVKIAQQPENMRISSMNLSANRLYYM